MKTPKALYYVFSILFIAALWKVLSILIDSPVLPSPESAIAAFAHAVTTSVFWVHFRESAFRVTISMAISLIIAFPLGIGLGYNSKLDKYLSPALFLTYPIPKIVFLPVIFVLFGLGNVSKVVLIVLARPPARYRWRADPTHRIWQSQGRAMIVEAEPVWARGKPGSRYA